MIVGGLAAAGVALGIAAAVPAQAHADATTQNATFVAGVRAGGVTGSVSTLIANGHTVCYDIDVAGMRPADMQHQFWLQTDMDEKPLDLVHDRGDRQLLPVGHALDARPDRRNG
jgi:hypothetical protein